MHAPDASWRLIKGICEIFFEMILVSLSPFSGGYLDILTSVAMYAVQENWKSTIRRKTSQVSFIAGSTVQFSSSANNALQRQDIFDIAVENKICSLLRRPKACRECFVDITRWYCTIRIYTRQTSLTSLTLERRGAQLKEVANSARALGNCQTSSSYIDIGIK